MLLSGILGLCMETLLGYEWLTIDHDMNSLHLTKFYQATCCCCDCFKNHWIVYRNSHIFASTGDGFMWLLFGVTKVPGLNWVWICWWPGESFLPSSMSLTMPNLGWGTYSLTACWLGLFNLLVGFIRQLDSQVYCVVCPSPFTLL